MRKDVLLSLSVALVLGLCWVGAGAQVFPENHYLVYEITETYVFTGQIMLVDQFSEFHTTVVEMDKFANPVMKNNEPIIEPDIHQTWWLIDDPIPPCTDKLVEIANQFGRQEWMVGDGRYLVLPAYKDMPGAGWPASWNHYKCYDAEGPAVNVPVQLVDQFGSYVMVAVDPVLFCNPCMKEVNGLQFDMVWPDIHLAVYRLDPPEQAGFFAVASDQFGVWDINLEEPIWLVLPTEKLTVVETESKSWGDVKSLYR